MNYSQSNEEDFILSFFARRQAGIFCDVGAFDGVAKSNTRALVELDWRGVLIEPVRSTFNELVENCKYYSRLHCLNLAISTSPGLKEMLVGEYDGLNFNGMDPRELSTLLRCECERWVGLHWRKEMVVCVPLTNVIPRAVEFLSIDTEGSDFDALRSLDLHVVRPQLIMVEHNSNRNQALVSCDAYLKPEGYFQVFDNGLNAAWTRPT